jgi:hypothetical protein
LNSAVAKLKPVEIIDLNNAVLLDVEKPETGRNFIGSQNRISYGF